MCGDKPLANTKVKLWDDDTGPDLDDLLEEGHTDSRGYFELSGHTSEITTIDPVSSRTTSHNYINLFRFSRYTTTVTTVSCLVTEKCLSLSQMIIFPPAQYPQKSST